MLCSKNHVKHYTCSLSVRMLNAKSQLIVFDSIKQKGLKDCAYLRNKFFVATVGTLCAKLYVNMLRWMRIYVINYEICKKFCIGVCFIQRKEKRIKMAIFYLLPIGRKSHGPNLQIVFSIVPKMMSWFIEFVKLTRIPLLFNVVQFHTPHCDVSLQ